MKEDALEGSVPAEGANGGDLENRRLRCARPPTGRPGPPCRSRTLTAVTCHGKIRPRGV